MSWCTELFSITASELPTRQQIKELTEVTLLYIQSTLPKIDVLPLPDIVNEHVVEADMNIDVTFSATNGKTCNVNQLLFEQHEFDSSTSSTKFRLTAPTFTEQYDYRVDGKISEYEVSGIGVIRTKTVGYGYVVSDLRFEEINHSLQITSVRLDFFLENVTIDIEGLKADENAVQQLVKLLEIYVVAKYNHIEEEQSKAFADAMRENFNEIMTGRSTEQVIQWLKEHTNGEIHKDFIRNFVSSFVKPL